MSKWIVDASWFGRDLDSEDLDLGLRWDLVMAALEARPDDDGDVWLLGDGPFDELAAEGGMKERFFAERDVRLRLPRLLEAMRRELPAEGGTDGWSFE